MKAKVLCVAFIVFVVALTGFATAQEGVWTQVADMPTLRGTHTAGAVNGKIYVIGGHNYSTRKTLSTVEEYDPATETWTKKAEMPTVRWGHYGGVVNGKIYAIGGGVEYSTYGISTVEEYDPMTDTWTTKAPLPTARWCHASCALDGKIYVIGGAFGKSTYIGPTEEYNPVTDTWTTKADIPTQRGALSCCAVNGKIYAIGGHIGLPPNVTSVGTVEEYDPVTDNWTTKAPLPTPRAYFAACTDSGKIYAIGGIVYDPNNPNTYLRTVEEYDPVTDTWTTKYPMPTERSDFAACADSGKIYVIGGGYSSNMYSTEVYVYEPDVITFVEDSTPVEYSLVQNYLNPFNPTTLINYCMDQPGMVSLVIYDLLGKKVTTLVDEVKTPGNYSVRWNAKDFASGVYFYRIELGGSKVLTQKMMLMK